MIRHIEESVNKPKSPSMRASIPGLLYKISVSIG